LTDAARSSGSDVFRLLKQFKQFFL
jgi:hypothetical protein